MPKVLQLGEVNNQPYQPSVQNNRPAEQGSSAPIDAFSNQSTSPEMSSSYDSHDEEHTNEPNSKGPNNSWNTSQAPLPLPWIHRYSDNDMDLDFEPRFVDVAETFCQNQSNDMLVKELPFPCRPNPSPQQVEQPIMTSRNFDAKWDYHDLDVPPVAKYSRKDSESAEESKPKGSSFQEESKPNQDESTLTHCPVCIDGDVGKHNHYGGRVCHSCRGFFRRSVQNNHYPLFECSTGLKKCIIQSKTRKSCKFCRFQNCIVKAGLQMEQVMTFNERMERIRSRGGGKRTDNISGTPGSLQVVSTISNGIQRGVTKDERKLLEQTFRKLLDYNHCKYYDFFDQYPKQMEDFLNSVKHGKPFPKALLIQMNCMAEMSINNFCFNLPDMARLSPYDRMKLVATNSVLIHALEWAWFLSRVDFPYYYDTLLEYGERNMHKHGYQVLDKLRNIIESINYKGWHISTLYSSNMNKKEHEQAWIEIMSLIHTKSQRNQEQGVGVKSDIIIIILLTLAMLFSSRNVKGPLEHPDEVKKVQRSYMATLSQYIRDTYPKEASERIREAMKATLLSQKFYQLHIARLKDT